jgi:hypothetical protein
MQASKLATISNLARTPIGKDSIRIDFLSVGLRHRKFDACRVLFPFYSLVLEQASSSEYLLVWNGKHLTSIG